MTIPACLRVAADPDATYDCRVRAFVDVLWPLVAASHAAHAAALPTLAPHAPEALAAFLDATARAEARLRREYIALCGLAHGHSLPGAADASVAPGDKEEH